MSLGLGAFALSSSGEPNSNAVEITVHKTPWCGCCEGWVTHLKEEGFKVKVIDEDDLHDTKVRLSVPLRMQSCHTAVVEGYVIEGHVPAKEILRLIKEKPEAIGIAVPGMPVGSPGMEMGDRVDAYNVILFGADDSQEVFAEYK
jgi:hypothetical protein